MPRSSRLSPRLSPRLVLRLAAAAALLLFVGPHSVAQAPSESGSESSTASRSGEGGDEELETFVPTEKVPADSGVAFPVDI